MVWKQLQLQEFPDKFVFQSMDSNSQPPKAFSIDRSDGVITPHNHHIIGQLPIPIFLCKGSCIMLKSQNSEKGFLIGVWNVLDTWIITSFCKCGLDVFIWLIQNVDNMVLVGTWNLNRGILLNKAGCCILLFKCLGCWMLEEQWIIGWVSGACYHSWVCPSDHYSELARPCALIVCIWSPLYGYAERHLLVD